MSNRVGLEALRSFCALAETDNVIEAGQRIGKTRVTITKQVLWLEWVLGVRLYNRRIPKKQGRLTGAGRFVYEMAQRAFRELDCLETKIMRFAPDGSRKGDGK